MSLAKTNKLVIVSEGVAPFGVGAEIAARAADDGIFLLDGPIRRVGGAFSPVPYSPALEADWLPSVNVIAEEIRQLYRF